MGHSFKKHTKRKKRVNRDYDVMAWYYFICVYVPLGNLHRVLELSSWLVIMKGKILCFAWLNCSHLWPVSLWIIFLCDNLCFYLNIVFCLKQAISGEKCLHFMLKEESKCLWWQTFIKWISNNFYWHLLLLFNLKFKKKKCNKIHIGDKLFFLPHMLTHIQIFGKFEWISL